MIDYKLFEFAAPHYTGGTWFNGACCAVGLYKDRLFPIGSAQFDEWKKPNPKVLRVSLVRHPKDVLLVMWNANKKLQKYSFSEFVFLYSTKHPGYIGNMFSRYKADIVQRYEDCPWALVELLDSLGVPKHLVDRVHTIPKQHLLQLPIKPWVSRELKQAEKEVFDRYDYY